MSSAKSISPSTKFSSAEVYDAATGEYQLLPFRFLQLDSARYVLTNEIGQYIVTSRDDLYRFARHQLHSSEPLYRELQSRHFLMDADSDVALDLLSLKVRSKFQRLADFTGLHIFVASLRCDHSCPYCQVSRQTEDKNAFDMSEETAEKSLNLVFESPAKAIKIEFQGGEPLLNFSLIQHVVESAKRRNQVAGRDLQFVIATNLSQLTNEMLAYADKHGIHFSTSLDGPADLHNANRPRPGSNSHEKAIEGINKVRSYLGPNRVSALMTTTQASLGRAKEIIDEYLRRDFQEIFLRPLSPYGFAIKSKWFSSYDVSEWLDFYFEGLDYIIDLNKGGVRLVEQYSAIILDKMFSPVGTGYVDLQSPAGIGISAVVYNYDGNVFASDESRMLAEMNDTTFLLGNVHSNTYKEIFLSNSLLDPLEESITESSPQCRDCAFQPFCGSDPVYHHATQGDIVGHKALSGFCQRNMAIMRRLVTLLEDDPGARKVLLSWARC